MEVNMAITEVKADITFLWNRLVLLLLLLL